MTRPAESSSRNLAGRMRRPFSSRRGSLVPRNILRASFPKWPFERELPAQFPTLHHFPPFSTTFPHKFPYLAPPLPTYFWAQKSPNRVVRAWDLIVNYCWSKSLRFQRSSRRSESEVRAPFSRGARPDVRAESERAISRTPTRAIMKPTTPSGVI
jgi:hypothetical protein